MVTNEDQVLIRLSDPFPCHLHLRAFRASGSQLCRLRTQCGCERSCIVPVAEGQSVSALGWTWKETAWRWPEAMGRPGDGLSVICIGFEVA